MDGQTDGQTDTQKFGGYNIIPCHFLWWGIKSRVDTRMVANVDSRTDGLKILSLYWDMPEAGATKKV